MKGIEVLATTLNVTPLDLSGNRKKVRETFRFVHDRDLPATPPPKAKIVVFPEFPLCGHCEDAFFTPWLRKRVLHETLSFLPETKGIVAVLTLPLEIDGTVYHAAAMMVDGRVLGFSCSEFVPESLARWFTPWPAGKRAVFDIEGVSYPVGSLIYDIAGIRLAVEFDPFRDEIPPRRADLLLVPGADPFELGRATIRRERLLRYSRKADCGLVFADYVGNEGGCVLYDGDSAVVQTGSLLAAERRFSFLDVSHFIATVDLDEIRKNHPVLSESSPGDSETSKTNDAGPAEIDSSVTNPAATDPMIVSFPGIFDWGFENARRCRRLGFYQEKSDEGESLREAWEGSKEIEMEEFPRAVAMGLYDYLRKTRSAGFTLSLSGGADSGAIAVIVRLMVTFGFLALGKKRFLETLAFIPTVRTLASGDVKEVTAENTVAAILTTVYQRTQNNSPITRAAAEKIAEAVGSIHDEFEIDAIIDDYKKLVTDSLGRSLSWETDDLALQNIQARSRGPSAWLLANLKGALLLSTGNRSEVACGYATMDGDSCGAISPIAGVSKAFLRRWLRWMETTGVLLSPPLLDESGVGDVPFRLPFPALRLINDQQPTAELRPLTTGQTDEADLMPYSVLDVIEHGIVEKRLLGRELTEFVAAELKSVPELAQADDSQITAWIEKFERLFARAQWKRYRYAPGFHLDRYDLAPTSGYRLPPITAGFSAWQDNDTEA